MQSVFYDSDFGVIIGIPLLVDSEQYVICLSYAIVAASRSMSSVIFSASLRVAFRLSVDLKQSPLKYFLVTACFSIAVSHKIKY